MEDQDLPQLILDTVKATRGYADEFGWPDRGIEEWGVISRSLRRALEQRNEVFFGEVLRRGRGNDPPDCESMNFRGERIAFEVTELVDGKAIQFAKHHGTHYAWADWPETKFNELLGNRLVEKGARHARLKGGPYEGGYVIVVYSGEPNLTQDLVASHLKSFHCPALPPNTSAYLVLGYSTREAGNPCFKLAYGHRP